MLTGFQHFHQFQTRTTLKECKPTCSPLIWIVNYKRDKYVGFNTFSTFLHSQHSTDVRTLYSLHFSVCNVNQNHIFCQSRRLIGISTSMVKVRPDVWKPVIYFLHFLSNINACEAICMHSMYERDGEMSIVVGKKVFYWFLLQHIYSTHLQRFVFTDSLSIEIVMRKAVELIFFSEFTENAEILQRHSTPKQLNFDCQ